MSDSITQGQFKRFLMRSRFIATGKRKNRYIAVFDGVQRMVVFHYHKDNEIIPTGTLSSISNQLGLSELLGIEIPSF